MSTNGFAQVTKSHGFAEVEILELVVLHYPWKNRILSHIVEAPMSDEVQEQQIVSVAEHPSLPGILILLHPRREYIGLDIGAQTWNSSLT